MNLLLHILTIENRSTGDTIFLGFDIGELRSQVADHCREEWQNPWHPLHKKQMPDDIDELIEIFFHDNDRDYLKEQEFELELPQPYASAPVLKAACFSAICAINTAENLEEIEVGLFPETLAQLRAALAAADPTTTAA